VVGRVLLLWSGTTVEQPVGYQVGIVHRAKVAAMSVARAVDSRVEPHRGAELDWVEGEFWARPRDGTC